MPGGWMSGVGGLSEDDINTLIDKVAPSFIQASRYVDSTVNFNYLQFTDSANPSQTDRAHMVPLIFGRKTYGITKLAVEVTSSVASSSCRLAIYQGDGTNNIAKTLLVDGGVANTTSTGLAEVTFTEVEVSGLCYLAYACTSGSVAIKCLELSNADGDTGVSIYGYGSGTENRKASALRYDFALGTFGAENSFPSDIEEDYDQPNFFLNAPRVLAFVNSIS